MSTLEDFKPVHSHYPRVVRTAVYYNNRTGAVLYIPFRVLSREQRIKCRAFLIARDGESQYERVRN